MLASERRFIPEGHEANLNPPIERGGNAAEQQQQRMAFVFRIFQAADHRSRGADRFSQLSLGQAGSGAQLADFADDFVIGPGFLQGGDPLGPS